jgi:hypothetical protein
MHAPWLPIFDAFTNSLKMIQYVKNTGPMRWILISINSFQRQREVGMKIWTDI